MTSFTSLRTRILTILGTGAIALTPRCGGTSETMPGTGGSSAGVHGGGTTSQGGSSSSGGSAGASSVGGSSSGGSSSGSTGSGGYGGIPQCQPPTTECLSLEALMSCGGVIDFGDAGGAGGDSGELECPIVMSFSPCFPGAFIVAGPTIQDGQCCYTVQTSCAIGRPFSVEGSVRTASVVSRTDWALALPPSDVCDALAAAWLRDALLEHSSVAAFARLSLELLALGAPPALIEDAQRASLDEIEHARLCFGLAARYSREPVGPGPLSIDGALVAPSLSELAARAVEEGCVGETLGALIAAEQARVARDPVIKAALERIAADEARHAELSWRLVRWALERGGQAIRETVRLAFERALETWRSAPPQGDPNDGLNLAEHGRLDPVATAELGARALRDVIEPCRDALLAAFSSGSAAEAGHAAG